MILLKEFRKASQVVYASVYYDEQSRCIKDVWTGSFGTQQNFRDVLVYVASEIQRRKALKWLADLRLMVGSFDSSSEWIKYEITPKVLSSGLLLEAVVLPQDAFAKLSAKETVTKINKFELRQFEDIQLAEKWLRETVLIH